MTQITMVIAEKLRRSGPVKEWLYLASIAVGLVAVTAARLTAAWRLPPLGDEPDDLGILSADIALSSEFFDTYFASAPDQARLPFLLAALVHIVPKPEKMFVLRVVFLLCHVGLSYAAFVIAHLCARDRCVSWLYVLSVNTSCYVSASSVLAITAGDGLYLMFHWLTVASFVEGWVNRRNHTFPLVQFSLLLGLCVASKLFGLILLFSTGLFLVSMRARLLMDQRIVWRLAFLFILFGLGFLLLNTSGISPHHKRLFAGCLMVAYFLQLIWLLYRNRFQQRATETKRRAYHPWMALVLISTTAGCVALCASPIYLDVSSILAGLSWPQRWNAQITQASSSYMDVVTICVIKYGVLESLITAVAVAVALGHAHSLARKQMRCQRMLVLPKQSAAWYLALVGFIHLLVVSIPSHKTTWYPLAVFPLFLLILPCLLAAARASENTRLKRFFWLCNMLLIAGNVVRYVLWYPYAHLDGLQYGQQHAGYNRAGFVSFEAWPGVYEALSALPVPNETVVNVFVHHAPVYAEWARATLNTYFRDRGEDRFRFVSDSEFSSRSDFAVAPANHAPDLASRLTKAGFRPLTTVRVHGFPWIEIFTRQ